MAAVARETVTTGRTVEEAAALGAAELGLRVEDATIEVLESGGKGWLGLGTQKARVRVARPTKGDAAARFLRELATILGSSADVEVQSPSDEGEPWALTMATPDAALWIGHRGHTLDAVRVLCDAAAARVSGSRDRISLDVGGYRERRETMLQGMAKMAADRARRFGREVALEPMNPADRRIVHMTVQQIAGVESVSRGDEPTRRVVVRPISDAPDGN